MQTVILIGVTTWLTVVAVSPAHAQNVNLGGGPGAPRTTAGGVSSGTGGVAAVDRQQRYRITTMERVLEGAVEHGASLTRDRLRSVLPADMLLSENASARGFRLDGYGVFFDVAVPSLEGTLAWMLPVLRQNNANLENALRTLQSFIESAGPNDNVQQAFKRLASQVSPVAGGLVAGDTLAPGGPATLVGQSQALPGGPPAPALSAPIAGAAVDPGTDRIMENPQEAYRAEVRDALMDVMLDHSRSLNLAAEE